MFTILPRLAFSTGRAAFIAIIWIQGSRMDAG
jgi:hypothetical protein